MEVKGLSLSGIRMSSLRQRINEDAAARLHLSLVKEMSVMVTKIGGRRRSERSGGKMRSKG